MNNDETTKKNAVENNSLMRKTKAQLVEIILRKDSIEKNLRADIKGTEKELENKRRDLNVISNNYTSLQNDYHNVCDDRASIECELKTKISKQRNFIWLLIIIFVISVIANITLYLM